MATISWLAAWTMLNSSWHTLYAISGCGSEGPLCMKSHAWVQGMTCSRHMHGCKFASGPCADEQPWRGFPRTCTVGRSSM